MRRPFDLLPKCQSFTKLIFDRLMKPSRPIRHSNSAPHQALSSSPEDADRMADRSGINRRWGNLMAEEAGLGEFDHVLVAIRHGEVDQRVAVVVDRLDRLGERRAAAK